MKPSWWCGAPSTSCSTTIDCFTHTQFLAARDIARYCINLDRRECAGESSQCAPFVCTSTVYWCMTSNLKNCVKSSFYSWCSRNFRQRSWLHCGSYWLSHIIHVSGCSYGNTVRDKNQWFNKNYLFIIYLFWIYSLCISCHISKGSVQSEIHMTEILPIWPVQTHRISNDPRSFCNGQRDPTELVALQLFIAPRPLYKRKTLHENLKAYDLMLQRNMNQAKKSWRGQSLRCMLQIEKTWTIINEILFPSYFIAKDKKKSGKRCCKSVQYF